MITAVASTATAVTTLLVVLWMLRHTLSKRAVRIAGVQEVLKRGGRYQESLSIGRIATSEWSLEIPSAVSVETGAVEDDPSTKEAPQD